MTPGRMYLRRSSGPTLRNTQRSRKKRRLGNVTLALQAEAEQASQESSEEGDETYQTQFEAVNMQKEVKEFVTDRNEEELGDIQIAVCDTDTLTLTKLCDETFFNCVELPSSLWGMHVEHGSTFVAFSHLSVETSDVFVMTDKVVLLEEDLVPKIFVRGMKLPELPSHFSNVLLRSFRELNIFLQEAESLLICSGTGIRGPNAFSEKCSLYLDKRRGTRCMSCSTQRNRLKKSEAQRQRRADIRAGRIGVRRGNDLENPKTMTLRIIYQEEEDGNDNNEEMHEDEADEGNEESAEDSEEVTYNET